MFGAHETQRLTRASFEPQSRRRLRAPGLLLAALVTGGVVVALGAQGALWPTRVGALEARNARLAAELERTQVELAMERATRTELERQIHDLNAQVSELSHQIGFLASRTPH
jgi:hypothetical protein